MVSGTLQMLQCVFIYSMGGRIDNQYEVQITMYLRIIIIIVLSIC